MKIRKQSLQKTAVIVSAAALASLINVQPASGGTRTWNGGATPDGNWTNPGNWNGVAPGTNDLLVFSGVTQTATTNNFPAATPFNNITFANGAGAFTVDGNLMELSEPSDAGSGQIANGSINNLSANAETIRNPLLIMDGNHKIISSGGGVLRLNGAITRSNGAVVSMSGNINVTGGLSTNGAANGILGGWAIYSNNWATLDANSNVVAYTGYTDVAGGGTIANNPAANVRIPTAGTQINTAGGVTAINSLILSAGNAAQVVGIGAGNKLVLGQNGGIYNSSPIASGGTYRNLTIGQNFATGGILTAGDGVNPATMTFGSPPLASGSTGFLTVNASIQDNNGAPVTVVIAGAYVSLNGSGPAPGTFPTNTYSGGTYILQGRFSQANPYSVGSGPIHIYPDGQMNLGWPITNLFDIEGTGTTENNGMGALRLYAALPPNTNATLPGTIYLRGNAAVCADNDVNLAHLLGFTGKITGPGSLSFGSPTATSRSGILSIGSTDGSSAIPNDYAGDTILNGIAGGSISTTLRIFNSADNNIMPHGSTGNFTNGPTGNLIFNGTTGTRQAIFDLNGSTQTVNGVTSTAASPANNIITDNGPGTGVLIIGDNNASSTFAGVIQNGVSITKIGAGAITLSGANTYTGPTIVQAGRLVTTTASTGAGNYSVSNNAALGVTVASAGTTLSMNNLTLDSGASVQLNAGSFGSPSTAIANVTGALNITGTVNISLSGIGLTAGGPFPILTYNAALRTGGGSFHLVTSPRIVATLIDDNAGTVSVNIASADTGIKWNGGATGNWDINNNANTIWQTVPSGTTAFYIESGSGNDSVIFDDTATGTTTVNLSTTLMPQTVAVTNSTKSYTFAGPGKISGATGLVKDGNNNLIVANSGNDFSGNITLAAGTLIVSNDWNLANPINGAGALVKSGSGTLTLSGDNSSFSGPVTVNSGTLSVLNSLSLQTASSITVTSGGLLDIGNNNVALGNVPITASGSGTGGNGAIVNSSGYSGGTIATSFQNLLLAGDTTIGGPGRLDFSDGTLSTGGQARKLTKVSISTLRMANLTIDDALGDIEVQGGTLSIQGSTPSMGNPAANFIVDNAAILQFNNMNNEIIKGLVVQDNGVVNNGGGANVFDGPVNLVGNGIFNIGGTSLTFTNVISGSGSLSKVTGSGGMYLSASNTYTGDTTIGAGILYLTEPGSINATRSIAIGTGATLDVSGRNDQTLTVLSGVTLSGNGTVNGNLLVTNGATLSPGTGLGALTVSGNASLAGSTVMEINKSSTNDVLNCFGQLAFGGTLVISNSGPAFADGDSFTLFPNQNYTGAFASISPATPGNGLAWDTNSLAVDGSLKVVTGTFTSPSTNANITSVSLSGANLIIHGTNNNVPNTNFHYAVMISTNISLPLSNWTFIVTNPFNHDGTFDYTNPIVPGTPYQYIDVQAVP